MISLKNKIYINKIKYFLLDNFFFKLGFWVFLVHPTVVLVLLSASVERCFVSCMRDFLIMHDVNPK